MKLRARWANMFVVVSLLCAQPAAHAQQTGGKQQSTQATSALTSAKLTRCVATVDAPCMSLSLKIPANFRRSLSQLDSAEEASAWSAFVAGTRLVGPGVAVPRQTQQPLVLLVLVEQSEAMGTEGAAFARIATTSLLQSLDSNTVRVGLAAFNTRRVRDQIDAVAFGSPRNAVAQFDQLAPLVKGDRGALVTAVSVGVSRLKAQLADSARGAVLVITTGMNDVGRRGDDPGLLGSAEGVESTALQVANVASPVWIVQLETPSARALSGLQMTALAGPSGRVVVTKRDPNAISRALQSFVRELNADRMLVFGAPVLSATSLARTAWRGVVSLAVSDRETFSIPLEWRPPLFTLPPYSGAADSAAVPAEVREALSAGTELASTRRYIALVLLLVALALWTFVPRLLWSGQWETAQDTERRAAYYRGKASTQELLLLRGPAPREGPPRKPSEPTAQTELLKRPAK